MKRLPALLFGLVAPLLLAAAAGYAGTVSNAPERPCLSGAGVPAPALLQAAAGVAAPASDVLLPESPLLFFIREERTQPSSSHIPPKDAEAIARFARPPPALPARIS